MMDVKTLMRSVLGKVYWSVKCMHISRKNPKTRMSLPPTWNNHTRDILNARIISINTSPI